MTATQKPERQPGTGVEKVHPKIGLTKSLLERLEPSFAQVLPEHLTPERMTRLALLAMNRQPELLDCTAESIAEAVMQVSSWGLEIGRTAHMVAYGSKATAIADYKGKIELAIRSHTITSCRARVVYEKDVFAVEYGLVERLIHVPAWQQKDRGKPIGVYAIAVLPNGETKFELMSVDEVDRIRQRSRAKDKGPWKTDPEEMAKKTVVHRLLKMIPQSPLLAAAFEAEEQPEPSQVEVRQTPRIRDGGYEDGPPRLAGAAAFAAEKPSAEPPEPVDVPEPDDRELDRQLVEQEGHE